MEFRTKYLFFSKLQEEWLHLAQKHNIWVNASNFDDLILLKTFFKKKQHMPENSFKI